MKRMIMKMMERRLIALCLPLLVISGCCTAPKDAKVISISTPARSDAAFKAAQTVLENMHFDIEKADPNAGVISTRPLSAGQFFELWRSDTVGCYNFLESNTSSIIRTAEITVTPAEQGTKMTCAVSTRRLDMPSQEANSSTDAFGLFTKNAGGLQSLTLNRTTRAGARWVDLGYDERLENRILERIQDRIHDNMKGSS
jgi:hypothetical protein